MARERNLAPAKPQTGSSRGSFLGWGDAAVTISEVLISIVLFGLVAGAVILLRGRR